MLRHKAPKLWNNLKRLRSTDGVRIRCNAEPLASSSTKYLRENFSWHQAFVDTSSKIDFFANE